MALISRPECKKQIKAQKIRKEILLFLLVSLFLSSCGENYPQSSKKEADETKSLTINQSKSNSQDETEQIKQFFCIINASPSKPNSANGVDCELSFWCYGSTAKYITFWVEPYNAVDDPVFCEIRKESERSIKYTGPSKTSDPISIKSENTWYNGTIKTIKVKKIKIELTNGQVHETENIDEITVESIYQERGKFVISKKALRNELNQLLERSEMTEEDFIANFETDTIISTVQDIFAPTSSLNGIPISYISEFSTIFKLSQGEFIYSLQ